MSLPSFSVEGKVVIITGASGGVGKALSLGFAEAGTSVVLVARRPGPLQAIADEIKAKGGKALAVPTDITKKAQVEDMVQKAVKEFGSIDVLINCAGGGGHMPGLEMTEEAWDEKVDFNLKAVFLCSQAAGKVMAEKKNGCIINYGTAAAQAPVPGEVHYASAKAGVLHLTRVLAAEWGRLGIRVNCISPGLIDDDLGRRSMGPAFEKFVKAAPLGRAASPEDFVGPSMFLASDAARYVTGAIINMNGGSI
jgi:NAD(P)-dependent dehydrogenase (short-subunit alcohol dehydrogenase family)